MLKDMKFCHLRENYWILLDTGLDVHKAAEATVEFSGNKIAEKL